MNEALEIGDTTTALELKDQLIAACEQASKPKNAIFIALVRQGRGRPDEALAQMRIIYLENGIFGTMVGESGGTGHHVTHGLGCDPDIDAFVEVIRQLTT